jgi:nicotinate-nucleotide adenylyltransferase
MRIGLLGGTFNPIHNGHLQIAQEVQKKLNLDSILFIPSNIPPHKADENIPSPQHRLEMTRLALQEIPHFKPCDIEIRRPGKSYTIQTISELRSLYPSDSLFFIIGMDAFYEIPTWKEADRLLTLCHFVIVSRPGHPFSRYSDFGPLRGIDPTALASLDRQERSLYTFSIGPDAALHFVTVAPNFISASEIRKKISAQKEAKNLLPEPVESYIIKNNLYRKQ